MLITVPSWSVRLLRWVQGCGGASAFFRSAECARPAEACGIITKRLSELLGLLAWVCCSSVLLELAVVCALSLILDLNTTPRGPVQALTTLVGDELANYEATKVSRKGRNLTILAFYRRPRTLSGANQWWSSRSTTRQPPTACATIAEIYATTLS